jgi:hypothetical protein
MISAVEFAPSFGEGHPLWSPMQEPNILFNLSSSRREYCL